MEEVREQVRVVLEAVESHKLEGMWVGIMHMLGSLLTVRIVEREKLKLTKLVHDLQRVLMDSNGSI
jgi:hypothetical protein